MGGCSARAKEDDESKRIAMFICTRFVNIDNLSAGSLSPHSASIGTAVLLLRYCVWGWGVA